MSSQPRQISQGLEVANKAIQRQANEVLKRGNVLEAEARALVEGQRNALVRQMRQHLSPFGRLYSAILKPSNNLPTLEKLVAEKGSVEAVLTSVDKRRAVVNRFAAVSRVAGPATIVIQITVFEMVISSAAPEDRGRVAAREADEHGACDAITARHAHLPQLAWSQDAAQRACRARRKMARHARCNLPPGGLLRDARLKSLREEEPHGSSVDTQMTFECALHLIVATEASLSCDYLLRELSGTQKCSSVLNADSLNEFGRRHAQYG